MEALLREAVGLLPAEPDWKVRVIAELNRPPATPAAPPPGAGEGPYKVDQKVVEPPERGDCMIACICTALEIPYDATMDALRTEIDRIVARRGDWFTFVTAWALGRGYTLHVETVPENVPPFVRTIAGGPSPRGCKAGHAVVCYGHDQLLHDPHPSRAGLSGPAEDWMWFEPIPGAASRQPEIDALAARVKVLDDLLVRARVFVEADVRMMEDISRHAPLPHDEQAKHNAMVDAGECLSQTLLDDIDAALNPPAQAGGGRANG
jgi:hypothetical protein